MVHSDVDTKNFTGEWIIIWLGRWTAAINQKDVMTFLQGKYPSGYALMFSSSTRNQMLGHWTQKPPPSTLSLCHLPEGAGLTQNQIKHLQLISAEDFFLKCSNQLINYDPRTDLHCHQIQRHYTVRSRCFYNSWPSWKRSPQNTIIFAGFLSKKQSEQKPEKEFLFKTDVYMCWGLTHFYHHYP